jgi:hypothetical protein
MSDLARFMSLAGQYAKSSLREDVFRYAPRLGHHGSIGIGGSLAAPPLPHHRTYGSVYGGSLD